MGGGQVGALCRRFRGAGALSRDSSEGGDRIETRRLAGIGDQSGENASGEFEGRRSESGLSGIHVPLLRGPARARVAVSQSESVGAGLEEGTGTPAAVRSQESRMPGTPRVRFDEGRVGRAARCRPLSYSTDLA